MIVVDYAQLMEGPKGREQVNRDAFLSEVTRGLKQLAGRFNACVLVGSQLNRAAANGEPGLEHLRESGGFESDSDAVLMLWELNDPRLALPKGHKAIGAAIKKNRDGGVDRFELMLNGPAQRIGEMGRDEVKL